MASGGSFTMKTRVLTRNDVEAIAKMTLAVDAVEQAFAAFGRGETTMPPKVYLSIEDHDGDFRAMPSRLGDSAGIKWVNVHPKNRGEFGLPTVMATFILSDPATGFPLAVMDGTWLTALRTGAAGAVASKHLVRGTPSTLALIGAGIQARTLHAAHEVVFPGLDVLVHDRNDETAERLAREIGGRAVSLEEASGADIVCTATPSKTPFVEARWIRPGAHINAIGADAPGKQELQVDVLKQAAVYIDDRHQATSSGEINVPWNRGEIAEEELAGSLGDVVAGNIEPPNDGRTTVFDSTGLAIQDVSLGRAILEEAKVREVGLELDLVGLGP